MSDVGKNIIRARENGAKVVGCFPLYPPLELLHSFGLIPLVLWDLKEQVHTLKESDRHLQPFTCSVARRITEFVLSTEGSLFDGFLMYNACDTLRNMPEIITRGLEERGLSRPFLKFHVPMTPARQTDSTGYFAGRIRELIIEIENAFGVRFSSERFLASVRLYNAIKKLSLEMENLVAEGRMSYGDFSLLIGKGFFMTPEDYLSALDGAAEKAKSNPAKNISGGRKIIVSGILPPPDALCSIIENAGLRVVGNDVASQARSYAYVPREVGDPVSYYTDFYRNHHPCTTLLYSSDERLTLLTGLIEKKNAQGLIFIGEKFCEYEYLEMPFIMKTLKQKYIAMLQLEIATDDHEHVEAFRTRIEAFSELIG
ncbi:MAG: 2-hydroxyacyl-CoA dehydratase family protein [Smithella sp.]|nr:2-hydroxyacyl-CoA dehydratase family protein [Smithella sp.]